VGGVLPAAAAAVVVAVLVVVAAVYQAVPEVWGAAAHLTAAAVPLLLPLHLLLVG
jgi:hypothetical protein